ncbi:MAG: glycoside hydrolase [Pirellulales bacterium]|nr:glycoside hydrolase [Pirellulales bacterium]
MTCGIVRRCSRQPMRNAGFMSLAVLVLTWTQVAAAVEVKVVADGESAAKAADCRRMIVGPDVNQPDPHPGYAGFVGWDSPLRLRDGTLLVGFSTGYWHASPPTPLRMSPDILAAWKKSGMPTDVDAPRGGRAMLIRSTDDGRTWSKPQTIIDTPWDDLHPAMVELPDGVVLCSLFTYPGKVHDLDKQPELACQTAIIRSTDGGKTWEQTVRRLPSPFIFDATDGPPVVLKDGSVVLAIYGSPAPGKPRQIAVFRSTDGGRTWTKPESFGMRMFEPRLIVLRDGTLLCLHGSYGAGGFRAIFSTDGGRTWIAPARDHGFAVDARVYGYGNGVELPDGSVLAVYIHTGGHKPRDARRGALFAIRLRVRPDHSGIDLLPVTSRDESVAAKAVDPPTVNVVVGENSPKLEQFAAEELCRYLDRLYGLKVQPTTAPEKGTGPICRNGPKGAAHKLDLSPFFQAARPGRRAGAAATRPPVASGQRFRQRAGVVGHGRLPPRPRPVDETQVQSNPDQHLAVSAVFGPQNPGDRATIGNAVVRLPTADHAGHDRTRTVRRRRGVLEPRPARGQGL